MPAAASQNGEQENLTEPSPPIRKTPSRSRGIGPFLVLLVLVNLSWSLYQLPLIRVIERRLCREYYLEHNPDLLGPGGDVEEHLCKINEVQKGLGWIQGTMETTWILGDFIMTIPLMSCVGIFGYRAVLALNLLPRVVMLVWTFCVGYFESTLPLNAILVSPIFSILGGECVFNSITYTLVAGLTEDHVLRASYFGQVNAVTSIFAFQLGPALASMTMDVSLWLPLWLGVFLLLLAIPVVTRIKQPSDDLDLVASEHATLLNTPEPKSIKKSILAQISLIASILTAHSRNFGLLLTSFFLTSLASSDTKLLPQYISKRYEWRFASVGYLLSSKAVLNFTLLTFVIPVLLRVFSGDRQPDAVHRANVRHALLCLVFSVLGAFAIGLSPSIYTLVPSLLLYALGAALPIFTYSLLKSPYISLDFERAERPITGEGQIFSIVMLVKTVGSLLGAPVMAALWIWGIGIGGGGLGVPYFVSALCYAAAIVVIKSIKTIVTNTEYPP